MPGVTLPKLARVLLAAMAVAFAAVLAQDVFGIVTPVWPSAWQKADNATELLAVAACALRAARTAGAERAAWLAFTIGLFAYFAGDVYWTVALSGVDEPPFPSPADAGYLGIYPPAPGGCRRRSGSTA